MPQPTLHEQYHGGNERQRRVKTQQSLDMENLEQEYQSHLVVDKRGEHKDHLVLETGLTSW